MHILLIDDSSSTRSLLRTLINSGQAVRHEISEAASGEEALQKVASGEINVPDLIIADINMGGMNGYDLCREFRQRHGTPSDLVPYIIIVTANEGMDVITQALDSGANDYMPKPVNVKVLQVRLRVAERMLSQAQAQAKSGALPGAGAHAAAPVDTGGDGPGAALNGGAPQDNQISLAIDQADAPIALVDVSDQDNNFQIVYANVAMTSTTQFEYDQLMGKSLADLEAWTPEFLKMVRGYVGRGAILSHVPLWSRTHQAVPVHLSFYPIRADEDLSTLYLVIHHF
jgi:CheY-like chemotaxis protein